MRTLLIDNYDAYTFKRLHLLGGLNGEEPVVVRNDELPWEELVRLPFDNVVISPGPGRPEPEVMHGPSAREHAVRGHPAGLLRRALPLARGRRRAAGAARDGVDARRRDHGPRAPDPPPVRRAVPSRVGEHPARPGAARELPRHCRPRAAPPGTLRFALHDPVLHDPAEADLENECRRETSRARATRSA
jgi:hypothetical protein